MKIRKKLGLVTIIIASIVSGLAVSGLLTTSRTLSSTGTVKSINVEVFWDANCTQSVSSIDWGTPAPGDLVNRIVFLRNSGTAPMIVTLTTSDWNPSDASNSILISWDKEGAQVDLDEVISAVLVLDVSSGISGISAFSFNIIIEGSG